jgi:hypothetical protein
MLSGEAANLFLRSKDDEGKIIARLLKTAQTLGVAELRAREIIINEARAADQVKNLMQTNAKAPPVITPKRNMPDNQPKSCMHRATTIVQKVFFSAEALSGRLTRKFPKLHLAVLSAFLVSALFVAVFLLKSGKSATENRFASASNNSSDISLPPNDKRNMERPLISSLAFSPPASHPVLENIKSLVKNEPQRISGIIKETIELKGFVIIEQDAAVQGGEVLVPTAGALVIDLSSHTRYKPVIIPKEKLPFIIISNTWDHSAKFENTDKSTTFQNAIFFSPLFMGNVGQGPNFKSCLFFGPNSSRGRAAYLDSAQQRGQFDHCFFKDISIEQLGIMYLFESCAFQNITAPSTRHMVHRLSQNLDFISWDMDGSLKTTINSAIWQTENKLSITQLPPPTTGIQNIEIADDLSADLEYIWIKFKSKKIQSIMQTRIINSPNYQAINTPLAATKESDLKAPPLVSATSQVIESAHRLNTSSKIAPAAPSNQQLPKESIAPAGSTPASVATPPPVEVEKAESAPLPVTPIEKRLPVPDDAAQKAAEKIVKDIFKADYTKTLPDDRLALARKLLKQALEAQSDAALRFVLLREATSIACQYKDISTACQSAMATSNFFVIDEAAIRLAALDKLSTRISSQDDNKALTAQYFSLADELAIKEQYDNALKIIDKGIQVARRTQDLLLTEKAASKRKILVDFKTAYDSVLDSKQKLIRSPDDPDANFIVGKYFCFVKSDWEKGLLMLARGSNPSFANTAKADIILPLDAAEQLMIGDAWWDISLKVPQLERDGAKSRARFWYEIALYNVDGQNKLRLEKRIQEVDGFSIFKNSACKSKLVVKHLQSCLAHWQEPTLRLSGIIKQTTELKGLVVIDPGAVLQGGVQLVPMPGAIIVNNSRSVTFSLPEHLTQGLPIFFIGSFPDNMNFVRNCVFLGNFYPRHKCVYENCLFIGDTRAKPKYGSADANGSSHVKNCYFLGTTFGDASLLINSEFCAFIQCRFSNQRLKLASKFDDVKIWDLDGSIKRSLDSTLYFDEKRLNISQILEPVNIPLSEKINEIKAALDVIAENYGVFVQ